MLALNSFEAVSKSCFACYVCLFSNLMFARGLTFLDEVLQSGSNNAWQFSLFSEAYRVCYYAVHTVGLGIQ